MQLSPGLPHLYPSDDLPPDLIHGYVSVTGVKSLFTERTTKLPKSTEAYHAKKTDRDEVRHNLEKAGFTVLTESPLGLAVVGPPAAWESISGAKIQMVERDRKSVV